MKITGFGTISGNSGVQKNRRKGQAGAFADILSSAEAASSSAAGDVAAPAAMSSLLALQEISEEDVHRRKSMQRGNNMLDVLDGLRRQILGGGVTLQTLEDMERELVQQRLATQDPRLEALMDDIELRVAVELAKLKLAQGH